MIQTSITRIASNISHLLKNEELVLRNGHLVKNLPMGDCPVRLTRSFIVPETKFEEDIAEFSASYVERKYRDLSGLDVLQKFLASQFRKLGVCQRFFEVKGANDSTAAKYINYSFFAKDIDKVKAKDADCLYIQVEDSEVQKAFIQTLKPIEKCWYSFKANLNKLYQKDIFSLDIASNKFLNKAEKLEFCDTESRKTIERILLESTRDEFGVKVYTDADLMASLNSINAKLLELSKTLGKIEKHKCFASKKDLARNEELTKFYTDALLDEYTPLMKEAKRRGLI